MFSIVKLYKCTVNTPILRVWLIAFLLIDCYRMLNIDEMACRLLGLNLCMILCIIYDLIMYDFLHFLTKLKIFNEIQNPVLVTMCLVTISF